MWKYMDKIWPKLKQKYRSVEVNGTGPNPMFSNFRVVKLVRYNGIMQSDCLKLAI